MTRYYLVNDQHCTFDKGKFGTDAEAVRWGAGRGGSYDLIDGSGARGGRLVASWRNGRRFHSEYEEFRGSKAVKPKASRDVKPWSGRKLYAVYVQDYRYDLSRGKVHVPIVGWCYTSRDAAVKAAWRVLDEMWDRLVEGSLADPCGEYPVWVTEIDEARANSPEAVNHDPEWYEGAKTHLKYGQEPWAEGSANRRPKSAGMKTSRQAKPKTSRNGKDPEKVLFDAFYDKGCLMLDSNRTEGPDGVSYYPVVVGKEGGYRVYSVMPKGSGFDIPTCYAWYKNQRDANDMAYDLSTWWAKYGKAEPDGVWGGYRNGRSIEDDRPKGSASRKSTAKKTSKAVKPKASQPRRKNRQSAKKPKNSKGTKGVRS